MASSPDGKPAILSHAVGKGRTIYFASNPFTLKGIANEGWKAFFKKFQSQLGLKTGQDIWRFQFPKSLIQPPPAPEGKCLTNNHILWRGCLPDVSYNLDTQGTYRYTLPPDQVAGRGHGGDSLLRRQADRPAKGDRQGKRHRLHQLWRYEPQQEDDAGTTGSSRGTSRTRLP